VKTPTQTKGRPRKRQPKPGERVSLGLRVTPHLKAALDDAAAGSGRSQSQEAELRLERSFYNQTLTAEVMALRYGTALAGLALTVCELMKATGQHAAFEATATLQGMERWWENPYAYDQALQSVTAMLEAFRPAGEPELPRIARMKGGPSELDFELIYKNLGSRTTHQLLMEIASDEYEPRGPKERVAFLRSLLGSAGLLERIAKTPSGANEK
jgi:hypothetical protein